MEHKKNFAAIDIGTNSFHLVVTEVNLASGKFRILTKEKEIVRLGSGSTDMKYISESAMNRGIAALKRFGAIAGSYSAEIRAIATSAVREALNRDEFLRRVRSHTSIKIEIASGTEEARLIHLGVLQSLPVFHKNILLIDIGGGSTEFLVGKGRQIFFSNSLKIGAVRLTERFFQNDTINKNSIDECRKFVKGSLVPLVRGISEKHFEVCVGSSGTIDTLTTIIRASKKNVLPEYVDNNNFTFSRAELFKAVELVFKAKSIRKRRSILGMDADRVDIITAGAIIIEQIFKELKLQQLTFSGYALREGIILDSIEKLHLKHKATHLYNIRYNSLVHLGEMYQYEKTHAHHVTSLSLSLFDQTKKLHGFGEREREYLQAAAILHEIGGYVSHSFHHRHSYYLIRNADLMGFTENEKEIIANVARYHRKSHPKAKHETFSLLSTDDKRVVTRLAAILRIADGFDRSHASFVKKVKVTARGKNVQISIKPKSSENYNMAIWGADRKKKLFEDTFRCIVKFG
jgi:exopolyphosphatase/guanosine-5'-triphosphate,3'-diphosphate pyrophosphatase